MEQPVRLADRAAHVGIFTGTPTEELQRLDVAEAVDDLPHQHRTAVGRRLRPRALLRQKSPEDHDVQHQPADDGQRQPPVLRRDQPEGADHVEEDVDDSLNDSHRGLADRAAGLHHPVGETAREIALEETKTLTRQTRVELPAEPVCQAGIDANAPKGDARDIDQRTDEHDAEDDQKRGARFREEALARCLRQEIDDAADEIRHQRIRERVDDAENEDGHQWPAHLRELDAEKRHKPRRLFGSAGANRVDQPLEPEKNRIQHCHRQKMEEKASLPRLRGQRSPVRESLRRQINARGGPERPTGSEGENHTIR